MDNRSTNIFMAKLAEQAERYDEMKNFMYKVAVESKGQDLSVEERNLLSVAYKNVVGARRASWRVVQSIEAKEESKGNEEKVKILKGYRKQVETELNDICNEILSTLRKVLIPFSESLGTPASQEATVFYLKMEGDYHRYLAEFQTGEVRNKSVSSAAEVYGQAKDLAKAKLLPTNPIRLGLALNFSVFYYEILGEPGKACSLAKEAFDDAVTELDRLEEDSYKDATLIMQLLRDNLTLWMSDESNMGVDGDGTELQDM